MMNNDSSLTNADRMELEDAIDALVLPDTPEAEVPKIRALELIRSKAPNLFRSAQPILISILSSAIQKAIGLN